MQPYLPCPTRPERAGFRLDTPLSSATSRRAWRCVRRVRSSNKRMRRTSARNRLSNKVLLCGCFIFAVPPKTIETVFT